MVFLTIELNNTRMTLKQTYAKQLQCLGKRVKHYRVRKKISQEVLGLSIGVSNSYVSHLEAGDMNPTFIRMLQLCEVLGVRLIDLL